MNNEAIENKMPRRSLKDYVGDYLVLFGIAGAVIGLDQLSKALVRSQLGFGETWMPLTWLAPYARIVHWSNTGAAFGLFKDGNLIFMVLAVVVSLVIIYYYPSVERDDWPLRVAMGLQMGGALGNFVDRVAFGQVTDFISVGRFPVFNVADSSITMGVVVLLLGVWLSEQKARTVDEQEEAS